MYYSLGVLALELRTLQVCMLVTDGSKIDLKDGRLSVTILCTLAEPYIIPGLEPEGLKSLYFSMKISFLSLRVLRTSVTLFSI